MKHKLIELHQKSAAPNTFLVGYALKASQRWLTFLSVDPAGNEGGIRFIRLSDIAAIRANTEYTRFFQFLINRHEASDPFALASTNRYLLSQNLNDIYRLLQVSLRRRQPLRLTLTNGATYAGIITNLNGNEVRLVTYDEDKKFNTLVTTNINLRSITEIVFNDVDLKLSSEYFSYLGNGGKIGNDLDLVQIYFQYVDDYRFNNEVMIGWIANQSPTSLLVEQIDDIGQVVGLSLVNRLGIAHMTKHSAYLNYINFASEYNLEHGQLDPHHFDQLAKTFPRVPSLATTIQTAKSNHVLLIDDYRYTAADWGTIMSAGSRDFIMRPLSNFQFAQPLKLNYADLCSLDLISTDTIHMQTYLHAVSRL